VTAARSDSDISGRIPNAADVADAARLLNGAAVRTPLLRAHLLEREGGRVFLKCEIFQHTGSFKFRGAYNCIARIPEDRREGGVVAYSSGNHAQGVAAAAKLLGLPALIVMPRDAPALKRERTAAHGAEVVLYDRDGESREEIAGRIARERSATLVPPYDHPHVIAGQGTVGLEICEELAAQSCAPDLVLVPASGGGLLAGTALAVKDRFPSTRLAAVEPAGFDDHARSFASGRRERNVKLSGSICDALLTPTPGELTFEITRRLVQDASAVSDGEVRTAIGFAFRELKLVLEPGGAVALAALLAGKIEAGGKNVVLVLSGGNADPKNFGAIIGA
jgi:threonine dehydratase